MFEVLAEPTRRRILDELRQGERTVTELVAVTGMSQPAISKHLRTLRDAGVVEARVDAQHRHYRIRPDGLAEIEHWLEPFRRLWAGRLDDLGRHLDKIPRAKTASKKKFLYATLGLHIVFAMLYDAHQTCAQPTSAQISQKKRSSASMAPF